MEYLEQTEDNIDPECKMTHTEIALHHIQFPFPTDEERQDFIKYCEYMLWREGEEPEIPDDRIKEYFRDLYREIENIIMTAQTQADAGERPPITDDIVNFIEKKRGLSV